MDEEIKQERFVEIVCESVKASSEEVKGVVNGAFKLLDNCGFATFERDDDCGEDSDDRDYPSIFIMRHLLDYDRKRFPATTPSQRQGIKNFITKTTAPSERQVFEGRVANCCPDAVEVKACSGKEEEERYHLLRKNDNYSWQINDALFGEKDVVPVEVAKAVYNQMCRHPVRKYSATEALEQMIHSGITAVLRGVEFFYLAIVAILLTHIPNQPDPYREMVGEGYS